MNAWIVESTRKNIRGFKKKIGNSLGIAFGGQTQDWAYDNREFLISIYHKIDIIFNKKTLSKPGNLPLPRRLSLPRTPKLQRGSHSRWSEVESASAYFCMLLTKKSLKWYSVEKEDRQ